MNLNINSNYQIGFQANKPDLKKLADKKEFYTKIFRDLDFPNAENIKAKFILPRTEIPFITRTVDGKPKVEVLEG